MTGTFTSQLSDAVKTSAAGTASHSTATSAGKTGSLNRGAVVSTTVTFCVAATALPQLSAAVQTRVRIVGQVPFVVSANCTGTFPAQASVAVTSAGADTALHSFVASAGTPASTGARVSATVTSCVCPIAFPQSSAAVQVRRST